MERRKPYIGEATRHQYPPLLLRGIYPHAESRTTNRPERHSGEKEPSSSRCIENQDAVVRWNRHFDDWCITSRCFLFFGSRRSKEVWVSAWGRRNSWLTTTRACYVSSCKRFSTNDATRKRFFFIFLLPLIVSNGLLADREFFTLTVDRDSIVKGTGCW